MAELRCDAPASEDDIQQTACPRPAYSWNPSTELCYCDDHRQGLPGLNPLTNLPPELAEEIRERQKRERGA